MRAGSKRRGPIRLESPHSQKLNSGLCRIDHMEQARIEERIVEAMRALNALKKVLEHN